MRSIQSESNGAAKARAGVPLATTALSNRAPSMWQASPACARRGADRLDLRGAASTRRPRCWPSARSRPPGSAACSAPRGRIAGRTCAAVNIPRGPGSGRNTAPIAPRLRPPRTAAGARSRGAGSRRPPGSAPRRRPDCTSCRTEGTAPPPCPARSATMSCSRLTVGSSRLLLVAHFGLAMNATHGGRWAGDGVAEEVHRSQVAAGPGLIPRRPR